MKETENITFEESVSYLEFKEHGPYFSFLAPGAYLLEVWGAQGGTISGNQGAKGGYSHGILLLKKRTKIFVNVGETGACTSTRSTTTRPSYNGGGSGRTYDGDIYEACSGGGASDVRISVNDVYHRVIVAGAGGGYGRYYETVKAGGVGGGLAGERGVIGYECGYGGYQGNQTEGGKGNRTYSNGTFGQGGNASSWDGGGGGGGWFGGAAGQGCIDAGGGGSGFVLTKQTYSYAKEIPNYALNKNYFLTNAKTYTGNEEQRGFKTLSPQTGNAGNGKAKITFLHFVSIQSCASCNHRKMFPLVIVFIISQ